MRASTESVGTLLFSVALIALGGFIGFEVKDMPAGPEYVAVGPRSFPAFIAGGLVLAGLVLIGGLTRSADQQKSDDPILYDWKAVLMIAAAFGVQILILKWLGWIPTATLLFYAISRAFGGKREWATLFIGLVLACVTYGVFSHVLGLSLPLGVFSGD